MLFTIFILTSQSEKAIDTTSVAVGSSAFECALVDKCGKDEAADKSGREQHLSAASALCAASQGGSGIVTSASAPLLRLKR